jgi:hypothetical protein
MAMGKAQLNRLQECHIAQLYLCCDIRRASIKLAL